MKPIYRRILKISALAVLLGYVAVAAVWARHEAAHDTCRAIDITVEGTSGLDTIVRHGIERELKKYPRKLVGAQLAQLNTVELQQYLERHNNFESVDCMISAGGHLKIHIVPLVPIMRVFSGNKSYYINRAGKFIESHADYYTDVPIVRGNFSKSFPPSAVIPLVRMISENPELRDLTGMIEARDSRNLLLIPRIQGQVINMGDTSRLDEKNRLLTLFYRKVLPYKGWNEYDTISVKYKGQVVATRRIKPVAPVVSEDIDDIEIEEATLPQIEPAAATPTPAPAG